jgi:cyanate lyase
MDRQTVAQKILEAKAAKGLTWAEISAPSDHSECWVVAALLGQATMSQAEAETVGNLLDLDEEVVTSLTQIPYRGAGVQMPPTDPLIYRFYEIVMGYGSTFKELIQEKFGEGIMSAIDFEMDIQKKEDPKGDRVIVTLNGKFLPYKKW